MYNINIVFFRPAHRGYLRKHVSQVSSVTLHNKDSKILTRKQTFSYFSARFSDVLYNLP